MSRTLRRRKRNRWKHKGRYIISAVLVLVVAALAVRHLKNAQPSNDSLSPGTQPNGGTVKENLLVVGGSAAHGSDDPNNNSYVRRAFQSLSKSTNVQYVYNDYTSRGGGKVYAIDTPANFPQWLKTVHPKAVVMSWGMLDDLYVKTPISKVQSSLRNLIKESLNAHAVVIVTSPPVVQASASYDKAGVIKYINAERSVVNSFHSKNVQWFDLYQQFTDYMTAHNETFYKYKGDAWHPNQAGHILAGQLLTTDLRKTFKNNPITFKKFGREFPWI